MTNFFPDSANPRIKAVLNMPPRTFQQYDNCNCLCYLRAAAIDTVFRCLMYSIQLKVDWYKWNLETSPYSNLPKCLPRKMYSLETFRFKIELFVFNNVQGGCWRFRIIHPLSWIILKGFCVPSHCFFSFFARWDVLCSILLIFQRNPTEH